MEVAFQDDTVDTIECLFAARAQGFRKAGSRADPEVDSTLKAAKDLGGVGEQEAIH